MAQGLGKLGKSARKMGKKGGPTGGKRKLLGKTKKGGGNGKLSERKRFGAGGSGREGRENHRAVHQFKKKRSATVRTTIEAEMAAKVLKTGQVLTRMRAVVPVRLYCSPCGGCCRSHP